MTSSVDSDPNNNNNNATTTPTSRSNANDDTINGQLPSDSSGIVSSNLGGSGSALSSPLLNGEHIVLLSLSNDNTPIDSMHTTTPQQDDHNNDDVSINDHAELISTPTPRDNHPNLMVQAASSTDISISPVQIIETASAGGDNSEGDDNINIGNIIINNHDEHELLDNDNNNNNTDGNGTSNNEAVYSPPPDSIIHSDLQSLSPPPLSFKSDSHHQYNVHHSPHSQSLFSGGGASSSSGLFDYAAIAVQQQHNETLSINLSGSNVNRFRVEDTRVECS